MFHVMGLLCFCQAVRVVEVSVMCYCSCETARVLVQKCVRTLYWSAPWSTPLSEIWCAWTPKRCKEPDMCLQKMKALVVKFVQDKKLSGVTAGNICRRIRNVNNKPSVYQSESYFTYKVILAYYFAIFFSIFFYWKYSLVWVIINVCRPNICS